jgi:hypothetical protein
MDFEDTRFKTGPSIVSVPTLVISTSSIFIIPSCDENTTNEFGLVDEQTCFSVSFLNMSDPEGQFNRKLLLM